MGAAITLAQYLTERGVKYDVVEHPFAVTASESAKTSHISLNRLTKAVVLKGEDGFILAVLPASPVTSSLANSASSSETM
jgi:Ala-tRNA(Pro) deacylase